MTLLFLQAHGSRRWLRCGHCGKHVVDGPTRAERRKTDSWSVIPSTQILDPAILPSWWPLGSEPGFFLAAATGLSCSGALTAKTLEARGPPRTVLSAVPSSSDSSDSCRLLVFVPRNVPVWSLLLFLFGFLFALAFPSHLSRHAQGVQNRFFQPGPRACFRASFFLRFPGWLFGPQHPPGNPGKRGNGGSDLRGLKSWVQRGLCLQSSRRRQTIGRTSRQNIWHNHQRRSLLVVSPPLSSAILTLLDQK